MITFAATTGTVTLPYAQDWTKEQWAFMAEQAQVNPLLAPTVSGAGIRTLSARVAAGERLTEYEIGTWLGGFWTGPIETKTTVTLAPGETLTPEGLIGPNYIPPPTTSGAIPPAPSSNVPTIYTAPPTVAIDPVVGVVSPVPATGGQAPTGGPIPQLLPPVKVTASPYPSWLLPLVLGGVILLLLTGD